MDLRLAVDIKSLALHQTGVAVYLANLLRVLVRPPAGVALVLIGPRAALARARGLLQTSAASAGPGSIEQPASAANARVNGIEYVSLEMPALLRQARIAWYDQIGLPRAVAASRADALFTPNCDAPVACRRPIMVTIHDLAYHRFPTAYPLVTRRYYGGLTRWNLRHAAVVLTDSSFSASELTATQPTVHDRLSVLPCPLDPLFMSPHSETTASGDGSVARLETWCARHGLTRGYFLYTGGFDPRKNVRGLVRGLAMWATQRGTQAVLAMTGVGHVRDEELRALSREAGSLLTLRLLAPLPREEMPQLYRGARALLYLSRYEGFSLPVLEALAVGVPVVATPVGFLASGPVPGVEIVREDSAEAVAAAIARACEGSDVDAPALARARARFVQDMQSTVRPIFAAACERLADRVGHREAR